MNEIWRKKKRDVAVNNPVLLAFRFHLLLICTNTQSKTSMMAPRSFSSDFDVSSIWFLFFILFFCACLDGSCKTSKYVKAQGSCRGSLLGLPAAKMRHIYKDAMILHDILVKARPDTIPEVAKTASIEDGTGQMLRVHWCWHVSYEYRLLQWSNTQCSILELTVSKNFDTSINLANKKSPTSEHNTPA